MTLSPNSNCNFCWSWFFLTSPETPSVGYFYCNFKIEFVCDFSGLFRLKVNDVKPAV